MIHVFAIEMTTVGVAATAFIIHIKYLAPGPNILRHDDQNYAVTHIIYVGQTSRICIGCLILGSCRRGQLYRWVLSEGSR